jgi:hypothetical protein
MGRGWALRVFTLAAKISEHVHGAALAKFVRP